MGGRGSGGSRLGSGRKPKDDETARLHGSRDRGQARRRRPAQIVVPEPMDDMTDAEKVVWVREAPYAAAARTLVASSLGAFRDFCEAVVEKNDTLAQLRAEGRTFLKITIDGSGQEHQEQKKHPLTGEYRALLQRVEAGRTRFGLAPLGKPMTADDEPVDEWAEFDDPTVQ
jgi:hypothetical protein